ncbi:DUF493 family protein [Eisenibacter elegans]|jgi:putative lipoic acid-binding regulatory protein|uniref:DUF493 family protein n=1 Tax=Eisenibacter elegans TaxID=997 RepID=UPI00041AA644|nr:DUF493 family protein [Eisenibacter elegans]
MNEKTKAFYASLHEKLSNEHFPLLYMFKFITPSNHDKIALLTNVFDENAEITLNQSKKGNYTSISARTVMLSPEEIIRIYQKAAEVEGVILL